jgi:hypothetical protein
MKSKKFEKKLMLNKKTIADLNSDKMGNVHGGVVNSQTGSCCLVHTDCPNCTQTQGGCATCYTCETCFTCEGQQTCDLKCAIQ